ncbi:MAG: hypothetical protein Q8S09_12415 [Hyphomonas sp.]|nr:hypothetical protein [Hyphomonas sp.]
MAELLANWPEALIAAYLVIGIQRAAREAAQCVRESRATGERAPLWPVWLVVTLAWPMLAAQRFVFWLIVLWDAAAAIRAGKREADHV